MEPAKIDWKRIESVFVEDSVYENINAPKWVDLLAPDQASVDDVAWFCRPDCNHPKTAEDFLKTPPSSKFLRSLERLPFGDRNLRDARLKRRGQSQSSFSSNEKPKFSDNSENQNPNSVTPQNQVEPMKMSIKSSSEKNKLMDDTSQNDELLPRLKSTLSARNLFAGKDILNHISDFCNELKKLATRARERENTEMFNEKNRQVGEKKEVVNERPCEVIGAVGEKEKERKPLLEMDKENSGGAVGEKEKERKPLLEMDKENSGGVDNGESGNKDRKRRNKRFDEAENIPVSLNLENVKKKGDERLLQIRTNPPSPQCFSVTRSATKTTSSKSSTYRSMEKKILQEVFEQKTPTNKGTSVSNSVVEGREARALNVFWFLKPCTLSG
ncbi:hypothetical protein WN944_020686 [Citrus x changshan-huyou]|uniref:Uncharacterized protein n=3 Tax=Citrus TaxID=2706 RepID=A0ACB8LMR9_CITSI|nr:hypothetical protein KPL71_013660 [Citrus sinensis]